MLCGPPTYADNELYKVKAAYIYEFTNFTHWSEVSRENIVIGVVGNQTIIDAFTTINGKTSSGRSIEIVPITSGQQVRDCCHIIFISEENNGDMASYLEQVRNKPLVSMLDRKSLDKNSAIISFVQRGTKLKFSVNLSQAKLKGFKFDSHLLKIATTVY